MGECIHIFMRHHGQVVSSHDGATTVIALNTRLQFPLAIIYPRCGKNLAVPSRNYVVITIRAAARKSVSKTKAGRDGAGYTDEETNPAFP